MLVPHRYAPCAMHIDPQSVLTDTCTWNERLTCFESALLSRRAAFDSLFLITCVCMSSVVEPLSGMQYYYCCTAVRWLQSKIYAPPRGSARIRLFVPLSLRDLRKAESRHQTLQEAHKLTQKSTQEELFPSCLRTQYDDSYITCVVPSPVLQNPKSTDLTVSWSS